MSHRETRPSPDYFSHSLHRLGNFFGHAPWVGIYVGLIPGAAQSLNTLISYAHKLTAERLKRGSRTRDLFYHLVCDIS